MPQPNPQRKGVGVPRLLLVLGDIDDNEAEPTIAAIIDWRRTPSPIVGPPRHFGPLFLGRSRSVLEPN